MVGLVYADALYQFAQYDPDGPWRQLADGITVAGIQQTWPATDRERQGLLPDVYQLASQLRDGPAINPATVQAPALRYFRQPAVYEFHSFLRCGWRVHVPGELSQVLEERDGLSFHVQTWSPGPSRMLINGVQQEIEVTIDGRRIALEYPHQFQRAEGQLVLHLEKPCAVELRGRSRGK